MIICIRVSFLLKLGGLTEQIRNHEIFFLCFFEGDSEIGRTFFLLIFEFIKLTIKADFYVWLINIYHDQWSYSKFENC